MTMRWIRSVQLAAVAAALGVASVAVQAQTAVPAPEAKPHHHKHHKGHKGNHQHKRGEGGGHRGHGGEPANADRMANQVGGPDEFARNSVARCSVFKTQEDQRACVERVRTPGQGSVDGGGVLREYTYEVPVKP